MSVAPRIHVLTATKSDFAVILRRGPSRAVASLGWHRGSGRIELAQWLRGRIKEYQSDLSPDGRHMIYFAEQGGQGATVVSRAPWLRAILHQPQDSFWGGGGAFDADGRLAGAGGTLPDGLKPVALRLGTDGFHLGEGFAASQVRRGWRAEGEGYDVVLTRALGHGWSLAARIGKRAKGRALLSLGYRLVGPKGQSLDQPGWTWADAWEGGLHAADAGVLGHLAIEPDGPGAWREIADLRGMTFEARKAPYEGVGT